MTSASERMLAEMLDDGAVTRFCFSDELTIYGAAALQPQLQQALSKAGDIELDFSEVRDLDSAGVQLLLLLERECQALNRTLHITALSAAARDVFELLNLPRFVPTTRAA